MLAIKGSEIKNDCYIDIVVFFTIQTFGANNDVPDDGGGGDEEYYLVDSPDSDSKVDILLYSVLQFVKNKCQKCPSKCIGTCS